MSPRWLNQVIDPAEMTEAEMRAELRHDLRVYEEVTFSLSKQAMGRRITVLVEELDRRLVPLAARSPSRTERELKDAQPRLRTPHANMHYTGSKVARVEVGELLAALHDRGWHDLAPEQQDELIATGWHPGPNGGCGRRIGRYTVGYCGTNGLCPRCWSMQKGENARVALETALGKIESGRVTAHDQEWARLIRRELALSSEDATRPTGDKE